jgi:hypothetical protein
LINILQDPTFQKPFHQAKGDRMAGKGVMVDYKLLREYTKQGMEGLWP